MAQTLLGVHQRVLMLDGHHLVVAHQAQVGDDVSPIVHTVAVANGAEDPGAVDLVGEGLGVKHAVFRGVVFVHLGVLGMEVVDAALQFADGGNGLDALPDQVRGVEVGADDIAHCRAEAEQGLGVIHAEAGVHLEGDLGHAVGTAELGGLLPIGVKKTPRH